MALIQIPVALGAFLSGAALPITMKVLSGLGFGILSYAAISTGVNTLLSMGQASYGGIAGLAAALVGLAGFGDAFGIVGGSMIAAAVIQSTKVMGIVK